VSVPVTLKAGTRGVKLLVDLHFALALFDLEWPVWHGNSDGSAMPPSKGRWAPASPKFWGPPTYA